MTTTTTITMRLRRGLAAGVVGALALTCATFVASPESRITSSAEAVVDDQAAEVEDKDADCDDGYDSAEFGGVKVSKKYGKLFNASTSSDHFLDDFVPQGLGVWENWRGGSSTEDLFLVGMHHKNEDDIPKPPPARGILYGMVIGGEQHDGVLRGWATLPEGAHAGGVKVHNGWVYVQKSKTKILRYSVERIREAFTDPSKRDLGGGEPTESVTDVSFFDIHGGYLYAGLFNEFARGEMNRYEIMPNGDLDKDETFGPIQIPTKAQGLLVLSDRWVFSTSFGRKNRGNVYVIRNDLPAGTDFTTADYDCFRSVAMIQELVSFKGRTYLLNESGAQNFADGRIHDIRNLHRAQTKKLRDLPLD